MFISSAYAQSAAGGLDQQLIGFAPIVLMFVVLYFLMIRPQTKRAKELKSMIEALKKGDEVVTSGGLAGRISAVSESFVTLEVARANGAVIDVHVQKSAVQTLLPNGTLKSL